MNGVNGRLRRKIDAADRAAEVLEGSGQHLHAGAVRELVRAARAQSEELRRFRQETIELRAKANAVAG